MYFRDFIVDLLKTEFFRRFCLIFIMLFYVSVFVAFDTTVCSKLYTSEWGLPFRFASEKRKKDFETVSQKLDLRIKNGLERINISITGDVPTPFIFDSSLFIICCKSNREVFAAGILIVK